MLIQIVVRAPVSPCADQSPSPGASCESGEREKQQEGVSLDEHHT
jgi:hypothetical protein